MKKIILGVLLICLFIGAIVFIDQKNRVVVDSETGLIWEDSINIRSKNWNEAKEYCENLILDGYSNWRLPHIDELMTISDKSQIYPAIKDIFRYKRSNYYWSSTKYINDTSQSWVVYFNDGNDYWYYPSNSCFVRCVQ